MAHQQNTQKRNKMEARFVGIVRSVPSGDTMQIVEVSETRANAVPFKEIQFTLLGLKAPSFGRKSVKDGKVITEKDQDWAFESREFLRKLVVGKCISYRSAYEAGDRIYGEAWLNNEDLRLKIVRGGWADVIVKTGRKGKDGTEQEPTEDYLELLELKEAAELSGIGKWQKDTKKARHVVYRDSVRGGKGEEDLLSFFEKNRDKPLPGIVEQVRTGSTLRILLTKTSDNIPLLLSGIRCPVYKFGDDSECEPYSREAKFITEHFLLHRDVTVTIEGLDNFNNYFGTVVDSQGRNVSTILLQMGLANFVEWTAPKNFRKHFADAERQAQESKLRLWSASAKTAEAKPYKKGGKKESLSSSADRIDSFTGRVVEIVNAGTIKVRSEKDGKPFEHKIYFSSVNVPRLLTKKDEDALTKNREQQVTPEDIKKATEEELEAKWQSAFAVEAKEYLRSTLIGEEVKCDFDYLRPAFSERGSSENLPPRQFWSVSHKGIDVSVLLVNRGFAKVSRHDPKEPRSRNYQDLILAEKSAQKANKGIFGPKSNLPIIHKTDLTEASESFTEGDDDKKTNRKKIPSAKAAQFLTGFKRAQKMNAVVEFVSSGGRFKLWIPSQSVVIFFSLAGVYVPKQPNPVPDEVTKQLKDDIKFAPLALNFTREKIFQRNVEVIVYAVDKFGTFLGQLSVNRVDLGLKLVEEGLARTQARTVDKLYNKAEYKNAQLKAQKARKGIWYDYNEEEEREKELARKALRTASYNQGEEKKTNERFQIEVTEIIDGSSFCYQVIGEDSKALAELMTHFQNVKWETLDPFLPHSKGVVSAQFSQDDRWYRAEVLKIYDSSVDVVYIDYGNSENVPVKRIRAMPPEFSESVLPRQVKKGRLAYIVPPKTDDEYAQDAAALFKQLVWGKTLTATSYKDYSGNVSLVIGDPETSTTVNGALVSAGLARVERRKFANAFFVALREEEEKARENHLNIWQYGDIIDSDEEDK